MLAPLQPFDELADGRYRILSLLDQGGMASVYRAIDTRLDVARAIKVLNPDLAARRTVRRRFETEARTMARLFSPNIITVHDVGAEGERVYIVMELAEGGSLRHRVAGAGPLPPRLATRCMVSVLAALQVAHDAGVVHRDIKPHNVLITLEGVPKVSDFGIAHVENPEAHVTHTGAVMGTWAYMPPEQRSSARSADPRADVYSVGATLYYVLTAGDPANLYVNEDSEARLRVIPEALRDIVQRATRFKPEHRFASAAEMLAALSAVLPRLPEDPPGTPPLALPPRLDAPEGPDPRHTIAPFGDRSGGSEPSAGRVASTPPAGATPRPPLASLPTYASTDPPSDAGGTAVRPSPSRRGARGLVGLGLVSLLGLSWYGLGVTGPDAVPAQASGAAGSASTLSASTAPGSTAPGSTAAGSTEPGSTAAGSTEPGSTAPSSTPVVTTPDLPAPTSAPVQAAVSPGPSSASTAPPLSSQPRAGSPSSPASVGASGAPAGTSSGSTPSGSTPSGSTPSASSSPAASPPAAASPAVGSTAPPTAGEPAAQRGKLYVMSKPWSELSVGGEAKGRTGWSGDLRAGAHVVTLVTADGRRHSLDVSVRAGGETRVCWDFDLEAPCSR